MRKALRTQSRRPPKRLLILLNKPFQVLCQFTDSGGRKTLADYIQVPGVYAAGRLDFDSEGLVVLTNDGALQHLMTDPRHKLEKKYLAQVEGLPDEAALQRLRDGVVLKDGLTLPAKARLVDEPPGLWPREPAIRYRKSVPTAWIELSITEGRNRQVRRMAAAVGCPVLRLIRLSMGQWGLGSLRPGEWAEAPFPSGKP